MLPRSWRRAIRYFAAAGCILYGAETVRAADFMVYNHHQLSEAISQAVNGDTITFGSNILLTNGGDPELPQISANISINGNNFTLDGDGAHSGFRITGGTVAISNLTITGTVAQGGDGENGISGGTAPSTGGGGGGAGLGGAIFVGTGANVTVTNVNLVTNSAVGGDGGNAGSGGGLTPGGGGSGNVGGTAGTGGTTTGANGGAGGFAAGGGGGANGDPGDPNNATPVAATPGGAGAAGGYGAGGGGGGSGGGSSPTPPPVPGTPGAGGAGGGWGTSPLNAGGGNGGGGTVNTAGGGGGGSGLGGAVFIQNGGTLTFGGTLTVNGNTVTGGAGGTGGNNGSGGLASGQGIFLAGGLTSTTVTFAPGAGNTMTVTDDIVDEIGADLVPGARSGNLVKNGEGTLILLGANDYNGGTTVSAGILQGHTNSVKGFVQNNATVIFDQNFNGTFNGQLEGSGVVIKRGTGILTYDSSQDNRGSTRVEGGTLNVTSIAALPGGMDLFILNAGSSVTINGFDQSIGGLFGDTGTTMDLGSALLTVDPTSTVTIPTDTATYSGNIIGVGGSLLKNGTGTQILLGTNTYSGGTTIAGGILQGNTNSLQGNFVFTGDSNLIFDQTFNGTFNGSISTDPILVGTPTGVVIKNGTGAVTYGAAQTYTGGTIVNAGSLIMGGVNFLPVDGDVTVNGGTLNLNNFSQSIGGLNGSGGTVDLTTAILFVNPATTATYSGAIIGTGSLVKNGTKTQILLGTNTYSGGTTVSGGILQGHSLSLQGDILNNAEVVFDQNFTGTYAGTMSGTGVLTKEGTGTLILTGPNTYNGGTNVNAGILQGTTTSLQGNINNNTTVIFDQIFNGTFAGAISGPGEVIKNGSGNVTYGAAQTYTGGTTVNAGTLSLGGVNFLPVGEDVTVNGGTLNLNNFNQSIGGLGGTGGTVNLTSATLFVDPTATSTYSGNITGPGAFVKNGSGTQILLGTNNYTGGTTVQGGVLEGHSVSLQGNILNNAEVVFNQNFNGTYAGTMFGTGVLTKEGTGTLILTGPNSYGGGTFVNAGTLQGNTTSLQGNIFNESNVVFDQAATGAFAGTISGSGTVVKQNAGELIFNTPQTYTGLTTVAQGQLTVNSSLASDVLVNSGAVLSGTGSVGSTTVNGTIAPGPGAATLTVNGNYTQNPNSIYLVTANSLTQSDRIAVNGTAQLNGGFVAVGNGLRRNDAYTILTATGGVSGQYDGLLLTQPGYMSTALQYNGFDVRLLVSSNFAGLGGTDNQQSFEDYLDGLVTTPGTSIDNLILLLDTLNPDQALSAFDKMSGGQHASLLTVNTMKSFYFTQQLADQLRSSLFEDLDTGFIVRGQAPEEGDIGQGNPAGTWFKAYGVSGTLEDDGNAPGADYTLSGAIAGFESRPEKGARVGALIAYVNNDITFGDRAPGDAKGNGVVGGVYASKHWGGLHALGSATYGFTEYDTKRQIAFPGVNQTAEGHPDTHDINVYFESGLTLPFGMVQLQPIFGMQYLWLNQGSFNESGADILNLAMQSESTNAFWGMAGGRMFLVPVDFNGTSVKPYLHGKWVHDFIGQDLLVTGALSGVGGSFAVRGADTGRDFIVAGAGLSVQNGSWRFIADYTGLTNDEQTSHTGSASVEFRW